MQQVARMETNKRDPKRQLAMSLSIAAVFAESVRIHISIVRRFREHVADQYDAEFRRLRKYAAKVEGTEEEMHLDDDSGVLEEISHLSDQLGIVALHRIVELNTNVILSWYYSKRVVAKLYRSDKLVPHVKCDLGIDLESLPHFSTVAHLRKVNNAIKHGGIEAPRLTKLLECEKGHESEVLAKLFDDLVKGDQLSSYLERFAASMIPSKRNGSDKVM